MLTKTALLSGAFLAMTATAIAAPPAGGMMGDRTMTRADAQRMAEARFARMDANGDGSVDAAEQAAARRNAREKLAEGMAKRGRERRAQRDRADAVPMTKDAYVARAMTMFDRLDADKDGVVTAAERRAARAERMARRQGMAKDGAAPAVN